MDAVRFCPFRPGTAGRTAAGIPGGMRLANKSGSRWGRRAPPPARGRDACGIPPCKAIAVIREGTGRESSKAEVARWIASEALPTVGRNGIPPYVRRVEDRLVNGRPPTANARVASQTPHRRHGGAVDPGGHRFKPGGFPLVRLRGSGSRRTPRAVGARRTGGDVERGLAGSGFPEGLAERLAPLPDVSLSGWRGGRG